LIKLKFYFLGQQKDSSLLMNKQKSLPQNSQSKEKSASDHMTLAERKLNHFQKHRHSRTSNLNTTPASIISKPKENIKIPSKPSRVC
jgi:hypothetical protein